ncbi:hypothetical protein [Serinibacter arcticus]|nr:hypothetical protein [Serinibacter arcticus]
MEPIWWIIILVIAILPSLAWGGWYVWRELRTKDGAASDPDEGRKPPTP